MWLVVKGVKGAGERGFLYNPDQTQQGLSLSHSLSHCVPLWKRRLRVWSSHSSPVSFRRSRDNIKKESEDIKTYLHSNLFLLFFNSQENTNPKKQTGQINCILPLRGSKGFLATFLHITGKTFLFVCVQTQADQ